jgi:hypothetical protein
MNGFKASNRPDVIQGSIDRVAEPVVSGDCPSQDLIALLED